MKFQVAIGGCLLAECANLTSPPAVEILGRNIDTDVLQGLGAQVAVIWPLHTGVRIVALGIRLDAIDVETHDFSEDLAYLIFGVLVFA